MYKYRYGWTACVAGALALGGAQTAARAADRAVSPAAVPDAASDATSAPDAAPPPLASTPKRDIYAGDYLIIGVGAAVLPAYEGSHQHHVIPAFGLGGRIHGIGISPRSAGLALNIIPPRHSRIGLGFGPVIRYRGSRTVAISDPTPIRVGRGKGYLELGVNASISLKHVFSKYDSLSLGIDARWDASRGTGSRVLAPGLNYQPDLHGHPDQSRHRRAGAAGCRAAFGPAQRGRTDLHRLRSRSRLAQRRLLDPVRNRLFAPRQHRRPIAAGDQQRHARSGGDRQRPRLRLQDAPLKLYTPHPRA
jgi:hypothetical protein